MSEERWYKARQLVPGAILCCTHGTSRICKCVRLFNIDKNYLLTEQEVAVATATFELNRMERLDIDDKEKYGFLSDIIQSQQGKEDFYIEQYEQLYGPLPPKRTIEIPEPDQQYLPPEPDQQYLPPEPDQQYLPPEPDQQPLPPEPVIQSLLPESDPQLLSMNSNIRPPSPKPKELNLCRILLFILFCLSIISAIILKVFFGVGFSFMK